MCVVRGEGGMVLIKRKKHPFQEPKGQGQGNEQKGILKTQNLGTRACLSALTREREKEVQAPPILAHGDGKWLRYLHF